MRLKTWEETRKQLRSVFIIRNHGITHLLVVLLRAQREQPVQPLPDADVVDVVLVHQSQSVRVGRVGGSNHEPAVAPYDT